MRQKYFDAYDLRFIDELAYELRKTRDTTENYDQRRQQIFRLYEQDIQTREELLRAFRTPPVLQIVSHSVV